MGTCAAAWAQYSNSRAFDVASGMSVRGWLPSRANRGSSWLRTSTLTESIWISPMRSITRSKWASVIFPVGRGSASP